MPRLIQANEATAARRRVYFQLVGTDGLTPATGEAGGQPQASLNGAAWTSALIGTLTDIGNGRYYADLTTAAVATAGSWLETRYKSASTAECPGDSVFVVSYNPSADPLAGGGSVLVDQDYGGTANLSFKTSAGAGVDGATIRAYTQTDWTAGNTGDAFVVARSYTIAGGGWGASMLLDPGDYVLLYEASGYQPATKSLTVS